ncbi:hypothetical protein [Actinokineospora terrae]|uniref:hypothetical protein n=1 Tax=Actinokineospora terrae TaxID=155974 RepID=UPI001FEB90D1|nr:hypothetical protein [Actinokineospora terrae]
MSFGYAMLRVAVHGAWTRSALTPTSDFYGICQLDRGAFSAARHLGAAMDARHHGPFII